MKPYDWEQEDSLGHGAETRERDRSDMGVSPYKHPLYLDPDRLRPATEERLQVMLHDGLGRLGDYLGRF